MWCGIEIRLVYRHVQTPARVATTHHARFVDRNLNEPGAERTGRAQLGQVRKCAQYRLLYGIFRVCVVPYHRPYQRERHAKIRTDQFLEEVGFPGTNPLNQEFVAHGTEAGGILTSAIVVRNIAGNRSSLAFYAQRDCSPTCCGYTKFC